jgi:hypothetical protein
VDIGRPKRIIEVEPASVPVPESLPIPDTRPVPDPAPAIPARPAEQPKR